MSEMNTQIAFLYRDASNSKNETEIRIRGEIAPEQVVRILDALDDGVYFVPEKVGLPANRWKKEYDPQLDHPWCELRADDFHQTGSAATIDLNVADLVARFEAMKNHWADETVVFDWFRPVPEELQRE